MTTATLTFDADKHEYRSGSRRLPSVTEVIGSVFPNAYGPMTNEQREYVMHRGTAIHHGCRLWDDGVLDWSSVSPAIEQRIRAWESFRTHGLAWKIDVMEQPFSSNVYQFAGTPDRVFSEKGCVIICDIKSTYVPTARIQLGGYSKLLRDNGIGPAHRGVIVELHDDGTYKCEWIERQEMIRMENTFLAALTVFGFKSLHNLHRKEAE